MSYETILYEKTGRIIRITLNRPDKANALSGQMLEELFAAFTAADDDKEACVVVLRGAGDKAFCAGADLGSMSGVSTSSRCTRPGGASRSCSS